MWRVSLKLLSCSLLLVGIHSWASESGQVLSVLSGNRIKLQDGRVIRYIGVDLPKTSFPPGTLRKLATESKDFNRSLVDRKKVTFYFDRKRVDRAGHSLAYVYVDETFVNAEMIRSGYAFVDPDPSNQKYLSFFQKLFRDAKKSGRGFWKLAPKDTPIKSLSKTSAHSLRPLSPKKTGIIVFVKLGEKYYYPAGHPRLGKEFHAMLIEDAERAGYIPTAPLRANR